MGLRVEAVWVAARGAGADVGLGQVLPSHRRARRRLRDLQGVPVSGFPDLTSGSPARRRGVLRPVRQRAARGNRNEVEMLMPVVAEVFGNIGITKDDVGFICSGSTDYLIGGPFSFVAALDAVGVWPPAGRVATSRWTAPGRSTRPGCCCRRARSTPHWSMPSERSSMGHLGEILSVQLDPYYLAPLWPDPTSLAALQAQAMIDKGTGHRSRLRRRGQPVPAWRSGTPRPRSPTTAHRSSSWPRTTRWRPCAATRCRR